MTQVDPRAPKLPATAVVLAGGRSLRMGVDKTLLEIGGEPLVARAAAAVGAVFERVIVVTNRPEALAELNFPDNTTIITDEVAYLGPLGGISTAFAGIDHEWAFVIAADMPHVSEGFMRRLWDARDGYDVVLPISDAGNEPLLALYRVAPVLESAREVLATGRRRIVAMFPNLNVAEIPIAELADVGQGDAILFNVNTPTDFKVAQAVAAGMDPSKIEDQATPAGAEKPRKPVKIISSALADRPMPIERPVTLYLNDVEVATVQSTPENLSDMAVGFLVSEGLLSDRELFRSVDLDTKRGIVYVNSDEAVPEDLIHKTRYITSGCGKGITFSSVGHARGLAKLEQERFVTADDIHEWIAEMARRSDEYRERGGSHSCGLVVNGTLEVVREDVGRHNAADKVIGYGWLNRLPLDSAVMLSTGRVSYEMTVKAAKARIPVVASRSAATDLSARIADELGITLIGYARGGKVVVYTHPERVLSEADGSDEVKEQE